MYFYQNVIVTVVLKFKTAQNNSSVLTLTLIVSNLICIMFILTQHNTVYVGIGTLSNYSINAVMAFIFSHLKNVEFVVISAI